MEDLADTKIARQVLQESYEEFILRRFDWLTRCGEVEVEYFARTDEKTGIEKLILSSLKKVEADDVEESG